MIFSFASEKCNNPADDNTLLSFAKSVTLPMEIITVESQNAIKS